MRAAFCTFPFSFIPRRSAPHKRVSLLSPLTFFHARTSYFNRAIDAINFPFLVRLAKRANAPLPPSPIFSGKMKKPLRGDVARNLRNEEVSSQWMPSPANSGITCPLFAKRINKLSRGRGTAGCSDRVPLSFVFSRPFPPQIMNFDIESPAQALRNFPYVYLLVSFLVESISRGTRDVRFVVSLRRCWSSMDKSHTHTQRHRRLQ